MAARTTSDVELIRRSPLFDAEWYALQVELPADKDAAAHYLEQGAAAGQDPSSHFSNSEYLELNPDVAQAGMNPLLHYERFGRTEGRPCGKAVSMGGNYQEHRLPRGIARAMGKAANQRKLLRNGHARILVIVHVFYVTSIPEICQYLQNLAPYHPRLVVSYVRRFCDKKDLEPFDAFGDVEYLPCENRGYDLAPFFDVLESIDLDEYDIIFKVHGKSTDRERFTHDTRFAPREWFLRLFEGILGPATVHEAIDKLMGDPSYGLVAEEKLLTLGDPPHIQRMVRKALAARGLPAPERDYQFVAGTCFAARADALKPLQAAGITRDDFAPVSYGIFALAHALERFICTEITRQGKRLQGIATHRAWGVWSQRIADTRYRKNGQRIAETLQMRFCDEDLLALDGIFFDSYEIVCLELGQLLTRDGEGELTSLADATSDLRAKFGVPWAPSDELDEWVADHFMKSADATLASMDAVPWSQAVIVNADDYIMCGHDVANALVAAYGPSETIDVVRYA